MTTTKGGNLFRRPSWELRNIVRALSMHSWLNTPAEEQRLKSAKQELADRRQRERTHHAAR